MALIKVKLVKLKTTDGLVEMNPGVSTGKVYYVDLESLQERMMYNVSRRIIHKKTIVYTEEGLWLPVELLDINPKGAA